MVDRKEYIDTMSEKLKDWDDDLIVLEKKAKESSDEAKLSLQRHLNELKNKKYNLVNKLDELKKTTNDTWVNIKTGLDKIELDIKETLNNVKNQLN